MTLDKEKFREYLSCYGADMDAWPQQARQLADAAGHRPEFAALAREEKHFESLLRMDRLPAPGPKFLERLIARSLSQTLPDEPQWIFFTLPFSLRVTAFAAVLMLGFIVGYGAFMPDGQDEEAFMQSYTDDSGATL